MLFIELKHSLIHLISVNTPKPILIKEPANQLAVKGANLSLECAAESPILTSIGENRLKIRWRHDNQNVREKLSSTLSNINSVATKIDSEIHVDNSTNITVITGQLHLFNVSYDSAGKYQCVVSNSFGTTYSQKCKITIGSKKSLTINK